MAETSLPFVGLRCASCDTLDPGPRDLCLVCAGADLKPVSVPGTGTLVSWTTVRRAPTRFKGLGPYTIAVVDLDAGVRVTGRLRGEIERLAVGVPVAAVARDGDVTIFQEQAR